jgi:hypothetical protein
MVDGGSGRYGAVRGEGDAIRYTLPAAHKKYKYFALLVM